jgi:Skp family chaperone for outer membrane proteins
MAPDDRPDGLDELLPPLKTGIGGNNPPDRAAMLRQELEEDAKDLLTRKKDLLASVARAPLVIEDEEWEKKVADVIRLITKCYRVTDDKRSAKKEPYLEGCRTVDGFFNNEILTPLDAAKEKLQQRLTVWQRVKAERARRAAEEETRRAREAAEQLRRQAEAERQSAEAEARRKAEEALRLTHAAQQAADSVATEEDLAVAIAAEEVAKAASAAAAQPVDSAPGVKTADELARQAEGDLALAQKRVAAKPAEFSRARGDLGAVASLRTFWDFKDLDRTALDLEALRTHLPLDALEKAVRSYIRANFAPGHPGVQIAGVAIYENTVSAVR